MTTADPASNPDPTVERNSSPWLRVMLFLMLAGLCAIGWFTSKTSDPQSELRFGGSRETRAAEHAATTGAVNFFEHARALAAMGPRQTGSPGCEAAVQYVAHYLEAVSGLKRADPRFPEPGSYFLVPREDEALVPVDHQDAGGLRSSLQIAGQPELPLAAVLPNGVNAGATPPEGLAGHLVWLGDGRREHWPRWDLRGCIAVLEFNSHDTWLEAAGAGAVGCVFLEPAPATAEIAGPLPPTSYAQADAKYLALLPLNLPRLYATAAQAVAIRQAAQLESAAVLHCGLRLETIKAPYIEAFVRGRPRATAAPTDAAAAAAGTDAANAADAGDRGAPEPYRREILVVAHLDGRAIAPALAYGGNETWAAAGWLAMVDFFARNPADFDLRFVLFTGHWQDFAVERAWAERHQLEFGETIALTIGLDFSPDSRDTGLQSLLGFPNYAGNQVLNRLLTRQGDRVPEPGPPAAEKLPATSKAGVLQMIERLAADHAERVWQYDPDRFRVTFGPPKATADLDEDSRYKRPDLTQSPRFYDASDPFRALGVATISVGCSEPLRPLHNTPLDRWNDALVPPPPVAGAPPPSDPPPPGAAEKNLRTQFFYAMNLVSLLAAQPRDALPNWPTQIREDYAGRVNLHLQVVEWNARRLWYINQVPTDPALRTYVMVMPTNAFFSKNYPGPIFPRVTSPGRTYHRGLQMFDYVFVTEVANTTQGAIDIPLVYAAVPDAQISVLAFTLDAHGHVTHASDLGRHGAQAFPILNVDVKRPELNLQLKLFPCGALTLFDLTASTRKQFSQFVERQNTMQWGGGDIDSGEGELLPIQAVQTAGSHTEPDAFSWIQQRGTAMVFLPPDHPGEVIVGTRSMPMAILNNADETHPDGAGYRLPAGGEVRLAHTVEEAIRQSQLLTDRRLDRYRALGVASPAADASAVRTQALLAETQATATAPQPAAVDAETRWASTQLARQSQDVVYKESYKLLVDVVSTTIFYFLVLLPFSYLLERLLFPQITLTRSAVVAGVIFTVFALLLYIFHPGFRLADNIVVALISFLVVILTLPALFLTMGRGLSLIRDWGRREMKQHQAGADAGGVVLAALSLAVSNMRRRKLRTGLTLTTITLLVLSLVVLTTTSAELRYRRTPSSLAPGSYRGVEIFNQQDHINGLHEDLVALLRERFGNRGTVGVRRYLDPGYETRTPVASASRRLTVPAVMLVSAADAKLFPALNRTIADGGVLTAGRWIAPEDVAAVVLPDAVAGDLNVSVGDTVRVYRFPLTVVGIVDHLRYEQLLDVNHKPLTTYSFHTEQTNHREPDYNGAKDCVYVAAQVADIHGWLYGPVRAMVFKPDAPAPADLDAQAQALLTALPAERQKPAREQFRDFVPAARERLTALTALTADTAAPGLADLREVVAFNAWATRLRGLADDLAALNLGLDIYMDDPLPAWVPRESPEQQAAYDAGQLTAGDTVLELSASADVSMKQSAMMIFPLLIAFFMILSIMIGSVYERKQEIYVFSAVGLAPRHVAIMFLAEAVVYAGIAAVLGYFLGIILLGGLRSAGLLPANFYPNYLGVFVIYSALLAFAATLLSALYPIWLAGRMVNPSLERTWSIDAAPQGADWLISLPFIAGDLREARGILCFLHHYLEFHVGSRSGGYSLPEEPPPPRMEGAVAVLAAPVWLAPFERNIVHLARVEAVHDPARNLYLLRLRLHLISGQASLWERSAHVFVDALRKQLLVWRGLASIDLHRMLVEGDLLAPPTAVDNNTP